MIIMIIITVCVRKILILLLFNVTVQKTCSNAEDECLHYKSLYERSQQELTDLAETHKQVQNIFLQS